jgi:hypothetical protein
MIEYIFLREALIKSVRGEPVEPRTDESPVIYSIPRSPFDKLRANGGLYQTFLSFSLRSSRLCGENSLL